MASTVFSDATGTPLVATWLNDVNAAVYQSNASVTGSVARTAADRGTDVVSMFDYMSVAQIADVKAGTHLVNIDAAFQLAVTQVCGKSKTLLIPAGVYELGTTITFPNKSWKIIGEGPTDTAISSSSSSISFRIFDFTGCNGPEHVVEDLSLNGKIGSGSTTSIGAYSTNVNGLVFRGVWFRGLYSGNRKTNQASYVDLINCVFEFNTTAIEWDDAVQCSIQNGVFYRNVTDAYMTGDLDHMTWNSTRHAEFNSYGIRLVGASRGSFQNLTFRNDATAYTPDLIRMEGACTLNRFNGVDVGSATMSFGRVMLSMAGGATCTGNTFENFRSKGAIVAAIEIGSGNTNNTFDQGVIDAAAIGIVDSAGGNFYRDMQIKNCTTTAIQQTNCTDNEFSRIRMSGNTIDWVTSGTVPTTWVDELDSTMAGLTSTRIGVRRGGVYGRTFYGASVPVSLSYIRGDRVLNISPAIGQFKAYTRITTGSGHVVGTDWVSEGNL